MRETEEREWVYVCTRDIERDRVRKVEVRVQRKVGERPLRETRTNADEKHWT